MIYRYLLFRIIGLMISIYLLIQSLLDYRDYKITFFSSRPIEYIIYDLYPASGRGGGHKMVFIYKGEKRIISISTRQFLSITPTNKINVYYSLNRDDFFTQHLLEQRHRQITLYSIISFMIIFPWEFFDGQNRRYKRKKWESFWSWF